MSAFFARVTERMQALNTCLVLGLDPHPEDLSEPTAAAALAWGERMLETAGPHAVAIKPNAAFFEAIPGGMEVLARLIQQTELPVLLDVKRGDIGSTARAQAIACYDVLGADAVTLQPWLGRDAVEPFLRPGRGVFVLCRTSNPGAAEVQTLTTAEGPAYQAIARRALAWGDDVGLVVGATAPDALRAVRSTHPGCWILAPGVGAQGATAADTLDAGARADGLGLLVPVSRAISRAEDPATAAARFATELALRPGRPAADVELNGLLALDCIRYGEFTLRSGETSRVYVDCRRLIGSPSLLGALAARLAHSIGSVARIAGVPTAGLPLGTALSLVSGVPLVYPRQTVKAHGTGRSVEGIWAPGERVVMVDDVATRGTSLLEAAQVLREAGLEVNRALVLVDRQSGAREALAAIGVELHALFSLDDLLQRAP